MAGPVVLVSDSTSMDPARARRLGAVVVPLHVVLDTTSYDEGDPEVTPEEVAAALRAKRSVSTSRASPERFATAYRAAVDAGASGVLSIHLSAEVSGTYESALLAAQAVDIAVEVVDSRQIGMGTAFAVDAAAAALASGASAAQAGAVARGRADSTVGLFYVHTLEYLRRGGRVGTAAAFVGSALAVKPLLQIRDGRIVPLERVRTSARALARLEELAVEAAGDRPVDIAVSHLADEGRASALADRLRDRIPRAGRVELGEVGAVIGAHVGPGMLAVVVSPVV